MSIKFTKQAEKGYKKLAINIQKKSDKQFELLLSDYRHPSLRTRKMGGEGYFEGRIDLHYRFTFTIEKDNVYIQSIGPHDEGLGKK